MSGQPVVTIIDDDDAVRAALEGLFRSVGIVVEMFASAQEYLAQERVDRPGCMVLDVRLPGQNGLDFYDELIKGGINRPVVFISGHADVAMSVRAMKAGAAEFLTKPVRDQDLLDAVHMAIERDRLERQNAGDRAKKRADYETLTTREREVLVMVVMGERTKQIAGKLGISEATVKLHRGNVMQKMQASSIPDLVWMADALGLRPTKA